MSYILTNRDEAIEEAFRTERSGRYTLSAHDEDQTTFVADVISENEFEPVPEGHFMYFCDYAVLNLTANPNKIVFGIETELNDEDEANTQVVYIARTPKGQIIHHEVPVGTDFAQVLDDFFCALDLID